MPKRLMFFISFLFFCQVSQSAPTAKLNNAASCPDFLENIWYCHDTGMPKDGSDETSYLESFKANYDSAKNLTSYLVNSAWPTGAYPVIFLDYSWRLIRRNDPHYGNGFYDLEQRHKCQNGALIEENRTRLYATQSDQDRNHPQSVRENTYEYVTPNADSLLIEDVTGGHGGPRECWPNKNAREFEP